MIYSHSVLGGYVCLKGSYMFHVPMLLAMLIFIKIPNDSVLAAAYPGEHSIVFYWYWVTIALHGLFSIMDLIYITNLDSFWLTGYEVFSLLLRYGQIGNFCIILMLYATGETAGTFENQHIKDLNFWILIELLVNSVLFINSTLYLILRGFMRDSITLELEYDFDEFEDFMSGEVKILLLNVFAQACMPATISTILLFVFLNDSYAWSLTTNEESKTFLEF